MYLPQSILLIGFPAAGKTTVAPLVAEKFGVAWWSTDALIERRIGKSIPEIVKSEGWEKFRAVEKQVLIDLLQRPPGIIDAGGGIVEHEDLLPLVQRKTVTVWLWKILPLHLDRFLKHDRPLPQSGMALDKGFLALWERRYPKYRQWAMLRVACDSKSPQQIADDIYDMVYQYFFGMNNGDHYG